MTKKELLDKQMDITLQLRSLQDAIKNETIETSEAEKKIAELRSMRENVEKEIALATSPVETRSNEKEMYWADVQNAMKEKRSVTLSGTENVSVASNLVKKLEEKTSILNEFSIQIGGKKREIIPVWNASIGEFVEVEEDGTFTATNAKMATVEVMPKAYAKSIRVTDETLKLSAVNFENELDEILSKSVERTLCKKIFSEDDGSTSAFKGIYNGATEVTYTAWNVKNLQAFALKLKDLSDDAVIVMSSAKYAELEDGATKKDEILMNQIINHKEIEGVRIILTPYATDVIGGELKNYAIGIANELEIKPKDTVGTLAHTFDCSIYTAGKPIIATDFFKFVVETA